MTYHYNPKLVDSIRVMGNNLCKEILTLGVFYAPYIPKTLPGPRYHFSRAQWYDADHRYDDYEDVIAWCTEQFGPRPRRPDAWTRWYDIHIDRIRFRDEKDYQWFLLRWAS